MAGIVLLDLLGGIALLLWGLHMVQSGVIRAFGSDLRRFIAIALKNRWTAFLVGLGITAVLQSSTATALMATSFTARRMVSLVPALALMLGANVGTSLVVQVLSFNVSAAAPVLLLIGLVAFRRGGHTRTRDLGRAAIGLGLMLLALHTLLDTLAPAENAPTVRVLLGAITAAPILNLLLAAFLAWAAHSSVAVVVLIMSLAYSGFITPEASLALVLGANLGSAINPLFEAGKVGDPATRRLPIGNLANRIVGCLLVLPFLSPITAALSHFDPNPVRLAADFHTAFNLALAALFILPLDPIAALLTRLLPERRDAADPGAALHLDDTAIEAPAVGLTCASRETLHLGDLVETMLRQAMTALMTDDRKLVAGISRMDNAVDRLHEAIKLYVIKLTRSSLDDSEGQRAMEIIAAIINLEHIGDIIDKNLMELAAKKIKRRIAFSKEGAAELEAFHLRVLESMKLALGVFISGDVKIARQLLAEKVGLREAEFAAADNHLARMREGRLESIESSSLHLDVLRDLKRIHSHITAFAYPVLERAGELSPSRLRLQNAETASGMLTGEPRLAGEQPQ